MKNLEQNGVRKKWITDRKRIRGNGADWISSNDDTNKQKLLAYAQSGVAKADFEGAVGMNPDWDPPREKWEQYLDSWLRMHALMRAFEVETLSLDAGRLDTCAAAHAFAAMYTHEIVQLNFVYLSPKRMQGRLFRSNWFHAVPFAALGMVIGCRKEAERLARLYLALYHRGYDKPLGYLQDRPTNLFIMRLMADYLGEMKPPVQGRAQGYPTYLQLADCWRNPNPEEVVPLLLAACDLHTHHLYKQPDGEPGDFDNLEWSYTPIEILLVLKLRQLIGLENPMLDHPIMNGPFAALPPEVPFVPDELIAAVRARMMQDNYDEERIAARILNDEYPLASQKSAAH